MKAFSFILFFSLALCAQSSAPPDKNAITPQERMEFFGITKAAEFLTEESARVQDRLEMAEELAGKSRSKDNAVILHDARTEAALMKRLQDKLNAAFQSLANRAVAARGYKPGEAGFDPNIGVVPITKEKP